MSKYKYSFIVGWVLVLVPIILGIVDQVLFDCIPLSHASRTSVNYIDTFLNGTWILLLPGIIVLIVTRVLFRKKRGDALFTIGIELVLVLVSLLFIFSVILASLNTSRFKGPNAHIKSTLSSLRAEAEIYSNSGTYEGFCESLSVADARKNFQSRLLKQGLLCSDTKSELKCVSSEEAYAASAMLFESYNTSKYWCVDSTGFAGTVDGQIEGTSCKN